MYVDSNGASFIDVACGVTPLALVPEQVAGTLVMLLLPLLQATVMSVDTSAAACEPPAYHVEHLCTSLQSCWHPHQMLAPQSSHAPCLESQNMQLSKTSVCIRLVWQ